MEKKASGRSAKNPDEMGEIQTVTEKNGLTITSAQMRRIEKLTKGQQEFFWEVLDDLTNYPFWREDAHVLALAWEVLEDNARMQKERKKQK